MESYEQITVRGLLLEVGYNSTPDDLEVVSVVAIHDAADESNQTDVTDWFPYNSPQMDEVILALTNKLQGIAEDKRTERRVEWALDIGAF